MLLVVALTVPALLLVLIMLMHEVEQRVVDEVPVVDKSTDLHGMRRQEAEGISIALPNRALSSDGLTWDGLSSDELFWNGVAAGRPLVASGVPDRGADDLRPHG